MRIIFIAVSLFFLPMAAIHAQGLEISLKPETMKYAPKNFFITKVTDDRANKDGIGVETIGKRTEKITFNGGVADGIHAYINGNVSRAGNKQPAGLSITKLDIRVKKVGSLWHINENIVLSFEVAGQRSIEYITGAHGSVGNAPAAYIEMVLRQSIEADFKKFDAWSQQNKKDIPNDTSIKANVVISKTIDTPGFIVYSLDRPLQIADFQGPVQGNAQELAETESGLFLTYAAEVRNGQFTVSIVITPYFCKGHSWFRSNGKTLRVLAHEQAHFDITAINACKLADALRKARYTQGNYEQLIKSMQQQYGQESAAEEDQYDQETNHGTLIDQQVMWQNKISQQVRAIGCY